jgi:hypothetical protein
LTSITPSPCIFMRTPRTGNISHRPQEKLRYAHAQLTWPDGSAQESALR